MRWLLLLLLVAWPRLALAEPRVALAPLEDDDGKIAEMVGDAVSEKAKLTRPARVEGAMRSMGVSKLSAKSIKKLRAKLDVDVVIYGTVEKDGSKKRVSLTFAGSAKAKPRLEIEASTPKQLRKELEGKLAKRIASAMDGEDGDEEEDEDDEDAREAERKAREEERRKKEEEEERRAREEERRKKEEEEERKREEEAKRKKREEDERRARREEEEDERGKKKRRTADEDEEDDRGKKKRRDSDEDEDEDDRRGKKKRVAADEDEDDGGRARKRLRDEDEEDRDEDEDRPRKRRKHKRHVLTQTALWADAGAAFARRTLTWDATGMVRPPPVGTIAPAAQIEGEVYPAAFGSLKSVTAGLGLAASYSRAFALGIAVPGTQVVAPITSGQYSIGGRYRFVFGQHSLALGVAYWRHYYMADRSKLMNADQLDMPDVDYKAIAPGATARIAATPKIAAFGSLEFPLMLNSGPIQQPTSYGAAKILAFDFRGGTQIMVANNAALEISLNFTQIALSFTKQAGSKASTREVSAATDRSMGLSATIGITY